MKRIQPGFSPASFCKTYLLLVCSMLCLYASAQKTNQAFMDQVDSFLQKKVNEMDIPGLAVAVVKNGTIIKISTYGSGNLEWHEPVSLHTNFQIASCSKLFASTIVMKAVYEKKISLEDPIAKYIDSIPASWKNIRIKNLLSHTSGIKPFVGDPYAPTQAVVRSLKDSALAYAPESDQSYLSYDYTVLRYILEQVYGKPYEQIVKDEIANVAGMTDGGFDMERKVNQWMQASLIQQKSPTYYGTGPDKLSYKYIYPAYTYTAGGYFASISDMAKWAIALDKETFFPRAIETSLAYATDMVGKRPSGFSKVGWTVSTENNIRYGGHSGGPGLGDVLRFPEQGYTFIVLSNDGELLPTLARAIASFYIPELSPKLAVEKFKR